MDQRLPDQPLRIGTRSSPLALAQADAVRAALVTAVANAGVAARAAPPRICPITTTGDRVLDRPLAEIGGKGLFSKEIDAALLDGRLDLAVHSAKDLETHLPDGLVIAAMLPRADPRDAWISTLPGGLADLPIGSLVGTSSIRRRAQLLERRPDLFVVPLRGNVQTRLRKVKDGVANATLLARAGLLRVGLAGLASAVLEPEEMLPAAGQGAIAVVCRATDTAVRAALAAIDHRPTHRLVMVERALLAALDGSCRTPIGALAVADGEDRVWLRALLAAPDGTQVIRIERRGLLADGAGLAGDGAAELLSAFGGRIPA